MSSVPLHYRGVPVPPTLRAYWNRPIGRWWRLGIDGKGNLQPFEVLPGQIYQDNDYRQPGRTFRVDRLTADGEYAVCTVLTNYHRVQAVLDLEVNDEIPRQDMRGTQTLIKTRRLYPNARGYALLAEPESLAG